MHHAVQGIVGLHGGEPHPGNGGNGQVHGFDDGPEDLHECGAVRGEGPPGGLRSPQLDHSVLGFIFPMAQIGPGVQAIEQFQHLEFLLAVDMNRAMGVDDERLFVGSHVNPCDHVSVGAVETGLQNLSVLLLVLNLIVEAFCVEGASDVLEHDQPFRKLVGLPPGR